MAEGYDLDITAVNAERVLKLIQANLGKVVQRLDDVENKADETGKELSRAFSKASLDAYHKGLTEQVRQSAKLVAQWKMYSTAAGKANSEVEQLLRTRKELDRLDATRNTSRKNADELTALRNKLATTKAIYEQEKRLAALNAQQNEKVRRLKREADALRNLAKLQEKVGKAINGTTLQSKQLASQAQSLISKLEKTKAASDAFNTLERELREVLTEFNRVERAAAKTRAQIISVGTSSLTTAKAMRSMGAVTGLARNAMDGMNRHISVYTGGAFAAAGATYAVARAIRESVRVFSEFETQIQRTAAVTSASVQQTEKLKRSALEVSQVTVFTASETSEAMVQLGMAGLNTVEVLTGLEPTLRLASIGMLSFGEAADIATNVMQGFQLSAEQLPMIADTLAQAITDSNATLQQMGNALSYAAPVAESFGVSLQATTAAMEVLHNAGLKASRAGTGMRRILISLYTPTVKASQALADMGVSTLDAQGKTRSFIHVLQDLGKAIEENRGTMADLRDIVGVRAFTAFSQLVKATGELSDEFGEVNNELQEFYDIQLQAVGAARQMQSVIEDTLAADWKKLVAALEAIAISLVDVYSDDVRAGIRGVTQQLLELANNRGAILDLAESLKALGGAILALVKIIAALVAGGVIVKAIKLIGKFQQAVSVATRSLLALFGALRGAALVGGLATGPIGWVIAALTTAGTLTTVFWDELNSAWDAFNGIATAADNVTNAIDKEVAASEKLTDGQRRQLALVKTIEQERDRTAKNVDEVARRLQTLNEQKAVLEAQKDGSEAWAFAMRTLKVDIAEVHMELSALNSKLLENAGAMKQVDLDNSRKQFMSLTLAINSVKEQYEEARKVLTTTSDSAVRDEAAAQVASLFVALQNLESQLDNVKDRISSTTKELKSMTAVATETGVAVGQAFADAIAEIEKSRSSFLDKNQFSDMGLGQAKALKAELDQILSRYKELREQKKTDAQIRSTITEEMFGGGEEGRKLMDERLRQGEEYARLAKHILDGEKDITKEIEKQHKIQAQINKLFDKWDNKQRTIRNVTELTEARKELEDMRLQVEALKTELQTKPGEIGGAASEELEKQKAELKTLMDAYKALDGVIKKAEKTFFTLSDRLKVNAERMEEENKLLKIAQERNIDLNRQREMATAIVMRQTIAELELLQAKQGLALEEEQELTRLREALVYQDRLAAAEADRNLIKDAEKEFKEMRKLAEDAFDSLTTSLTDSIVEGLRGGKDAFKNFKDEMEDLFANMVLRPVIQAALFGDFTGLGGLANFLGGTGGGGSGLSALSNLSGIGDIFSSGLSGFTDAISGLGSIFGIGSGTSVALGTAATTGLSTFLPAGGAYGSAFGLGGSAGSAFAATGGAGALSSIGAALPYLGLAVGAFSLLSGLFEDEPDPRFFGSGPLGNATITDTQDMESAAAQRFVDTLNAYEQSFLDMLTKAEREALKDFEPTDLSQISGHGDAGSTHELSAHILKRMKDGLREIDEVLAGAFGQQIQEAKSDQMITTEEVDAIVGEFLAPILAIRKILREEFDKELGNWALATENITAGAGSLDAYAQGIAVFFDAFYDEEEKFEKATESLTESLSELGIDAIPETRESLRALIEGLDLTTEADQRLHGALIALVPELDAWYTAAEETGEAALSAAEKLEKLTDIMDGVEDQLADLTLSDFLNEIRDINIWFDETTESAQELGASQEQLAQIQQVAALRTKQAIDELQSTIDSLILELYGTTPAQLLDDINEQISIEQQRLQEANAAARELYNQEMTRYREAQAAIDSIGDHLASLAQSTLSPLTPWQKYQAARTEYQSTLGAARAGDANALSDIVNRRTSLLEASQFYYASSTPFQDDYYGTEQDLKDLVEQLGLVVEPTEPGEDSTSALLRTLEAERNRLLAEQEAEDRRALALELAGHIGDLGLALDTSVFDLLEANGVALTALAEDIGIDINALDADLVHGLMELAAALKVDFVELAGKLNVDILGLAQEFGYDVAALGTNLDNWLVAAANNIGTDVFSLAGSLGTNIDQLGNLFASELAEGFRPLAADIRTELHPLLQAVRDASDTAELETAMIAVRNYVAALPEAERQKLSPYLNNIFTATDGTKAGVNTTAARLQIANASLNQLQSIYQVTNTTKDLLNTITPRTQNIQSYLWANRQNTKLLVEYVSGLKTAPREGFRTGTPYVPRDMAANLHEGEIVVDPESSAVLRKYGIEVKGGGDETWARAIVNLSEEVAQLRKELADYHGDDMEQRGRIAKEEMEQERRLHGQQTHRVNTKKVA